MAIFKRHLLVGALSGFMIYLFLLSRAEWDPMHAWNRAYADASLVLLVATMLIGPLSRIHKKFSRFLPLRRELGIWCAITALLHVYILFDGWFLWEPIRLIIGVNQATGQLTFDPGFTLANLVGVVGLVYVLLLAVISNNKAIQILGKKGWDYLQQKSGTLYILVILHTAFFLFFFRLGSYNWIQKPFLIVAAAIFILQWTIFVRTVIKNKKEKNRLKNE